MEDPLNIIAGDLDLEVFSEKLENLFSATSLPQTVPSRTDLLTLIKPKTEKNEINVKLEILDETKHETKTKKINTNISEEEPHSKIEELEVKMMMSDVEKQELIDLQNRVRRKKQSDRIKVKRAQETEEQKENRKKIQRVRIRAKRKAQREEKIEKLIIQNKESENTTLETVSKEQEEEKWKNICERKVFGCDLCESKFTYIGGLTQHKRTHFEKYFCESCPKTFELERMLKRHILKYHSECKTDEISRDEISLAENTKYQSGEFNCNQCQKTCTTRPDLKEHKRSHLVKQTYSCEICGKIFPGKFKLGRHLNSHLKSKTKETRTKYTVEFKLSAVKRVREVGSVKAEKELNLDRSTLDKWIRLIFKPLYCTYCSKAFPHEHNLQTHEKGHTSNPVAKYTNEDDKSENKIVKKRIRKSIKQSQCDKCSKLFNKPSRLKLHMLTCGTQPKAEFQCENCPKSYVSHFALKYHSQSCTGDITNSRIVINDPKFIESVVHLAKETSVLNSSSVFKLTYARVWYWVKQAEGGNEYFCEICQKTFPYKSNYRIHMKRHENQLSKSPLEPGRSSKLEPKVKVKKQIKNNPGTYEEFSLRELYFKKYLTEEEEFDYDVGKELMSNDNLDIDEEASKDDKVKESMIKGGIVKPYIGNANNNGDVEERTGSVSGIGSFPDEEINDEEKRFSKYLVRSEFSEKEENPGTADLSDESSLQELNFQKYLNQEEVFDYDVGKEVMINDDHDLNEETSKDDKTKESMLNGEIVKAEIENSDSNGDDEEKTVNVSGIGTFPAEEKIFSATFVKTDLSEIEDDCNQEDRSPKVGPCQGLVNSTQGSPLYENPDAQVFSCCGRDYPFRQSWRRHVRVKHEGVNFPCHLCSYKAQAPADLRKHMRFQHPILTEDSEDSRLFSCELCDFKCKTKRMLLAHKQHRHPEVKCEQMEYIVKLDEMFQCTICMGKWEKLSRVLEHVKRGHKINAKFLCEICTMQFYYESEYSQHMKGQCGIREIEATCDQCGKSFSDIRNMRAHIITVHTPKQSKESVRSFFCSFCEKGFFAKAPMLEHELLHSDDKTYSCPHCPKSFKQASGLRPHVRRMHNESGKPFMTEERKVIYKAYMKKYNAKYNAEKKAKRAEIDDSSFNHETM